MDLPPTTRLRGKFPDLIIFQIVGKVRPVIARISRLSNSRTGCATLIAFVFRAAAFFAKAARALETVRDIVMYRVLRMAERHDSVAPNISRIAVERGTATALTQSRACGRVLGHSDLLIIKRLLRPPIGRPNQRN